MVCYTKAVISGAAGPVTLGFRLASESKERHLELKQFDGQWCVADRESGGVWLVIEPGDGLTVQPGKEIADDNHPRVEFELAGTLAVGQTCEAVLKLLSPAAPPDARAALAALDFTAERAATLKYWEDWLAQGVRFEVPEPKVNELFRANLGTRSASRGVGKMAARTGWTSLTPTSPTANSTPLGRSTRPSMWTICSTVCAAISRSRTRSSPRCIGASSSLTVASAVTRIGRPIRLRCSTPSGRIFSSRATGQRSSGRSHNH